MKLNSEIKTILEYISSGQTDRLAQSEWKNIANKHLNKVSSNGQELTTETNQVNYLKGKK